MPTKLKGLEVTKVDFVDAGDNKRADVVLFKRKDGEQAAEPPVTAQAETNHAGILKRFLARIAKSVGVTDDEVQEVMEAIEKDAVTFDEKVEQRQRQNAADEIWDYLWMFQDSLRSIFWDDELTSVQKQTKMEESLAEFTAVITAAIPKWAKGERAEAVAKAAPTMTPERLAITKYTHDRLGDMIAKAEAATNPQPAGEPEPQNPITKQEGEPEEMKIDKSKLTAEELAALDAIEKKAGIPDTEPAPTPAPEPTTKAAPESTPVPADTPAETDEDIYKGLHPAVKAELERLRKSADAAEERELTEIAKKYEIIGKKPEELVPLLKSLKATSGDAYSQMLAVLDASVAAVEKSGIFAEVGKRGGSTDGGDAWSRIEKAAEEILKAAPTMTRAQAIDRACEQHPELVHDYEQGR